MAINAYIGRPRHGKTYEVVSVVILGALRDGRRVVSNIAGLNYQSMVDLLLAEGVPIEKIGKLECVTHDQIEKPSFWRTDRDEESGFDSFIQPGDLVALDEIWRFFKRGGRDIEPRAMNFFRMHGHMTHPETGFICQIALISQSIKDFNDNIRSVIEQTFRMVKLTKVGMDNRYRVEIYEGASISRADFVREIQRGYEAKYFPLYSSHSQKKEGAAEADEARADDRGNAFKSGFFSLFLPASLILAVVGFWFVWRFFHSSPKPETVAAATAQAQPTGQAKLATPDEADSWRAVGFAQIGGRVLFIVRGQADQSRYVDASPAWKTSGASWEVMLPNGEFATSWARPAKSEGLMPGAPK